MTNGSTSLNFKYNEAGLRTNKTVNGTVHTYYYRGDLLVSDLTETDGFYFHYDQNGDLIGFTYTNGTTSAEYYYIKNLQGDVLGILNSSGSLIVSYSYDAWGNILSVTGSDTSIANRNPIRYRSYYYDTETNYYYLQSRYYNPEIGRFINADGQLNLDDGLLGANMYAYCNNNPIIFIDYSGESGWPIVLLLALGAAIGGYLGYYSDKKIGQNSNQDNILTLQNPKPSQLPFVDPYIEKFYDDRDFHKKNTNNNDSYNTISLNENTSLLSQKERWKNAFFGASLGVATTGLGIAFYGAIIGVASASLYAGVPFLGGNAIQTFARGILAYDAVTIFVAPFWGMEMDPIELTP